MRNRQLALEAATALLGEAGTPLTVEAIAARSGLGAATVVRAYGGKEALLDAAVSSLLEPLIRRARELLEQTRPDQALRTFLAELIAFQSAHHAISGQLDGLNVPATTVLRAELVRSVKEMIAGALASGTIRTDIDPAVTATLIGEASYAIARSQPATPGLADAFITILMDGLRPQASAPRSDVNQAAAKAPEEH